MEYRHGSHTKYMIAYHFVWATKSRRRVLFDEFATRVRDLLRQTCEQLGIQVIQGAVRREHVHVRVAAPPQFAPSDIMRRVKGRSSRKIFEQYPAIRKQFPEGHFWERGYLCITNEKLNTEVILQYLEELEERLAVSKTPGDE